MSEKNNEPDMHRVMIEAAKQVLKSAITAYEELFDCKFNPENPAAVQLVSSLTDIIQAGEMMISGGKMIGSLTRFMSGQQDDET